MQEHHDREEAKRALKRLDAILTALEELNLQGGRRVPRRLIELLQQAGVPNAESASVPELIDRVLATQQPYLVKIPMERRRRRRRNSDEGVTPDPVSQAS